MRDFSARAFRPVRLCLERLVLLLMAALMLRTWFCEGLVFPCRISGGSMAEGLLGRHREVVCADCGHTFVCGAEPGPLSPRAVCPNCGYAANDVQSLPTLPGDRVLLLKSLFFLQPLRRWEVIAFASPSQSDKLLIKRVIGLPGERVQIMHGDVYINGQIQRKTLSQQRALAVLVHDAGSQPKRSPNLPPRWQNLDSAGRWKITDGRFMHGAGSSAGPIDWLAYRHWRRVAGEKGPTVCLEPVTDQCGYNQTQPRRVEDIHPVSDLMLSFRLIDTAGPGSLFVRASDGREEFLAQVVPSEKRYQIMHNGKVAPGGIGRLCGAARGLRAEVSLFDRQLLVAFGGSPVITLPYDRPRGSGSPGYQPFAIGSQGLQITLDQVRVYRDVYYTHPIGVSSNIGLDKPCKLGKDEYYVAGDNSPISEDSRTWPGSGLLSGKLLIGKVLLMPRAGLFKFLTGR